MKAVLISDVSPGKGHIYGLRVISLAKAMARRGHQIMVLSPTRDRDERQTRLGEIKYLVGGHDWELPLSVSRSPRPQRVLAALQADRFPGPVRRALTAATYASKGGMHDDWTKGALPLVQEIAQVFRPDVVWANFGNASNLVVGQTLAQYAGVPWFMDIKDNWNSYVPKGLRRILAHRFRDAAGFTSNARLHADIAARWNKQPHEVIYSSVATPMIAPEGSRPRGDKFQLNLIGSTYDATSLTGFLEALSSWVARLPSEDRARMSFHYAGAAATAVDTALARVSLDSQTQIDHNLSHTQLARLCHDAAANCYIWAPFTFHHKMLELVACRRPVISYPGEHEESKVLAHKVGGRLTACADKAQLQAAFDEAYHCWKNGDASLDDTDISAFSWDAAAKKLEAFMLANMK